MSVLSLLACGRQVSTGLLSTDSSFFPCSSESDFTTTAQQHVFSYFFLHMWPSSVMRFEFANEARRLLWSWTSGGSAAAEDRWKHSTLQECLHGCRTVTQYLENSTLELIFSSTWACRQATSTHLPFCLILLKSHLLCHWKYAVLILLNWCLPAALY